MVSEVPRSHGRKTNLGGHELGCTTERACCRAVPHVFLAQTVVGDLDMSVKGQENIVELQIAVDNPVLMEVLEG
jgi:hypothetical protein